APPLRRGPAARPAAGLGPEAVTEPPGLRQSRPAGRMGVPSVSLISGPSDQSSSASDAFLAAAPASRLPGIAWPADAAWTPRPRGVGTPVALSSNLNSLCYETSLART